MVIMMLCQLEPGSMHHNIIRHDIGMISLTHDTSSCHLHHHCGIHCSLAQKGANCIRKLAKQSCAQSFHRHGMIVHLLHGYLTVWEPCIYPVSISGCLGTSSQGLFLPIIPWIILSCAHHPFTFFMPGWLPCACCCWR